MGFHINEEVTTKLHYEDIALIAVSLGMYQENSNSEEMNTHARNLVNRLGREMCDTPENHKPNGH